MRYGVEGRDRRRMIWGVVLIGIGIVLLLDRLGYAGVLPIGHWWPAIFFVIGLARLIAPETPRQIASGITFILLGLWFFACNWHWYGLFYRDAWPLLLVIVGGEMILTAALQRARAGQMEREEHHA